MLQYLAACSGMQPFVTVCNTMLVYVAEVADTGWCGGGNAMSNCNAPNASQYHIA